MEEYIIDLQLFADSGEKTEKATPRKKEEARKKGQVLQSQEVNSVLLLLFSFICIRLSGGFIYDNIANYIKRIFEVYMKSPNLFTVNELTAFGFDTIVTMLIILVPIFLVGIIVSMASSYLQVGFVFSLENIKFNLDNINPLKGFKNMFSMNSLVELVKNLIKIVIVTYVAYTAIKGEINNVLNMMDLNIENIGKYITFFSLDLAIKICIILIILAVADYFYQWFQYEKNLRMSKQEMKEEYKQTEGNPQIKAKIKQKQRAMAMSRMMKDIPKADVVITNPTHFAVAIKYDTSESAAPKVVAKGQDFLAQRIKQIAKDNRVQIVENKPLARALYAAVEIGEEVPQEMYQAVAEVLAFVYSLK